MKIFARNFRGFERVELDLSKLTFLVGDNSSGKSSLIYLAEAIISSGLTRAPMLNEDLGVSRYDYFSPYLNNADVTFGLSFGQDEKPMAKILTVQRRRGAEPRVILCSYSTEREIITFKKFRGRVYYRHQRAPIPAEDIIDLHFAASGFKVLAGAPADVPLGEPGLLLFALLPVLPNDTDLTSRAFRRPMPGLSTLGPIRSLPEKYYTFNRTITVSGGNFATMWHDLEKGRLRKFDAAVTRFGRDGKLFDSLNVRPVSRRLDDSPLLVTVTRGGKEFSLNQVGVGVSQVVPVLAEAIFASSKKEPTVCLFQQPELHLHPIAQAALGTFFFKLRDMGFCGILESHSSFMIDRYRAEVRAGERKTADSACIVYCENGLSGNTATTIKLADNGRLDGAPDSYHKFFVDEFMRTML